MVLLLRWRSSLLRTLMALTLFTIRFLKFFYLPDLNIETLRCVTVFVHRNQRHP